MKTLKVSLLLFGILIFHIHVWSQERNLKLNLNYTVGIPAGNFKTVTDQVSPRGWDASLMFGITNNIALGLQTGLQDFYQRYPRQVIHQNGSDLSAVVTNSVQVTPILIKGKYRFTDVSIVQPYAAIAAGANLISYRKYYGEFPDSRSTVKFAAQPELGIYMPLGVSKKLGLNLSAGYNIMPFKYNGVNGLNHFVIKGGLGFSLR